MASRKSSPKNTAPSVLDEQTFQLMFEWHPAIMLFIEPETGIILDANQAAVDFYRYPKSKLCRMSIHEINMLTPEQMEAERQRALSEERNHSIFSHQLASGENRMVEIYSSPIALKGKQALFSIVHEINEYKQMAESLEKRITALDLPFENTVSVTFNDLFNLEDIQRLQDDFSKATGVASIITQVDGTPITAPSNFCALCNDIIRKTPKGYLNCCESDAALGQLNPKGPMVHPCMSGGLWDAGSGISVDGKNIANWLIGQVRDETQTEEKMLEYARTIGADEKGFLEAFKEVPAMSREKFEQIAKTLFTLADQLSTMAYQNLQQTRFISERRGLEEKLVSEHGLLSTLLDNLPDRVYVKDIMGRKIVSNAADWQGSNGRILRDVLGKSDFDIYPPELAAQFWADDKFVLDSGISIISREEPGLDNQGNPVWVLTTKVPLRDENGQITGLVGIGRDITKRKQTEEALNESKLLFHLLIESLPQNIYAKSVDGRFIFANQHYCATQGRSLEEIVGKTDFELHPLELAEKYRMDDLRVIETGKAIELVEEHQPIGEEKFFAQVIKTPFCDSKGQTAGTLGIFWDITERMQAEVELRYMKESLNAANIELQAALIREQQLARTDVLTGINNRRYLFELAAHEFNVAMRYRPPLSILMFDVDHFKQINDAFGHAIGDLVLQRITQVVCAEIRSADVIGRYGGGDEFIVLLPQTSTQEVLPFAERIHASISAICLDTDKGPLTVTISIGVAQTIHQTPQSDTVENLFLRADQAMYTAKQNGRNCTVIFDSRKLD